MLWVLIRTAYGTSNEFHNTCFCGEIRKISVVFKRKTRISGAMIHIIFMMISKLWVKGALSYYFPYLVAKTLCCGYPFELP